MKKQIALSFGLAALATVCGAQGIQVKVNSQIVNFPNGQPQEVGNRVMVPLRGVFEQMGADVHWNSASQTVTANHGSTTVVLTIGEHWARVNGKRVSMDTPAMLIDDSTMVPIRFVSESLGATVDWNAQTETVRISMHGGPVDTQPGPPYRPNPPKNPPRPPALVHYTLRSGTVIPTTLETRISSETSRRGDTVWVQIRDFNTMPAHGGAWDYDFPPGTRIQGQIVSAIRRQGNRPGLLEIAFNRIVLPDAIGFPIRGSLISLDPRFVVRDRNGMYQATAAGRSNRMIYAGFGSGDGLLLGIKGSQPLDNLASSIVSILSGSVDSNMRRSPRDFTILPGARLGVRIDRTITVILPPRR